MPQAPDPEYAMSAETGKKHEGWAIHASQKDYLTSASCLPAWLVSLMWDQEFSHVRDLAADPIEESGCLGTRLASWISCQRWC